MESVSSANYCTVHCTVHQVIEQSCSLSYEVSVKVIAGTVRTVLALKYTQLVSCVVN